MSEKLFVAYHPIYNHPLPEGHRFPMEKYELLPKQLVHEGTINETHFFTPDLIEEKRVLSTHDSIYFSRLKQLELSPREQRVTGFPHSTQLIERELHIMEGTRKCAELSLKNKGVALNIAGGTHHAFSNRGEGFCLLNDQAIASRYLLEENLVKSILIIDLDVHQGNGTAEIFQNDSRVFTFSIHGKNNYPLQKEKSDFDLELPDGTSDREYLYALEKSLDEILQKFQPEYLFYQSGVDILSSDKLGKMSVSIEACKQRDEIVFKLAKELDLPITCSMGGGYSPEIKTIIEAHANTFRAANQILG
jgi:acetoin utilization deacetylase AcuC-like enzyme